MHRIILLLGASLGLATVAAEPDDVPVAAAPGLIVQQSGADYASRLESENRDELLKLAALMGTFFLAALGFGIWLLVVQGRKRKPLRFPAVRMIRRLSGKYTGGNQAVVTLNARNVKPSVSEQSHRPSGGSRAPGLPAQRDRELT